VFLKFEIRNDQTCKQVEYLLLLFFCNKMLKIIYTVIFIVLTLWSFAQRFVEPDKMKSFNITVNYETYTIKTQMLKDPKKFTPDVNLTYHWYTSQKIMETKGGFDGKLLHGYYHSFYLNNQLFESGEFKYGVKSSEWKNWYPDGKLKEVTNWKNGKKKGNYSLYNTDGALVASGKFKNDVLNGKFKTYDKNGKVILTQEYKNGDLVINKPKKERKPLFKKKKAKTEVEPKPKENSTSPKKEKKPLFNRKAKKSETVKDAEQKTIKA
jgi:hypothetical protein